MDGELGSHCRERTARRRGWVLKNTANTETGHSMVGPSLEFDLPIERGKIRELALAVGEDNPLFLDPEAARAEGFPDVIAPPTFTVTDIWQLLPEERAERLGVDLDRARMLHGEQEYLYTRLPIAGEVLRGTVRVYKDTEKKGGRGGKMRVVTFETRFTDAAGQDVLTAYYTSVETATDPGA